MDEGTSLREASLPSPLPRRERPNPDEDLLSLLRRSATKMGYPDFRWLLRPEGKKWSIKDTEVSLLDEEQERTWLRQVIDLLPNGKWTSVFPSLDTGIKALYT